ncbi:MAG: hypothetical protein MZV64_17840 [Ignavibacteriales bacterium]|nr:hypothetical protein [Ignavibacteriales bacterium]
MRPEGSRIRPRPPGKCQRRSPRTIPARGDCSCASRPPQPAEGLRFLFDRSARLPRDGLCARQGPPHLIAGGAPQQEDPSRKGSAGLGGPDRQRADLPAQPGTVHCAPRYQAQQPETHAAWPDQTCGFRPCENPRPRGSDHYHHSGTGHRALHPARTIRRERRPHRHPLGHLLVRCDALSPAHQRTSGGCTQALPLSRKPGPVTRDQPHPFAAHRKSHTLGDGHAPGRTPEHGH